MCGILGAYNTGIEHKTFEQALGILAHRGPDASAVQVSGRLMLGHRRLSILDLSDAGTQPMWSNDKRYAIVFNGEIYNYLELKRELEGGYAFKTKTDTEVIIVAYSRWGEKCLERFNGMFAFAIWDAKERSLFIARDRLGEKPLYYVADGSAFLIASEIKALLALGVSRQSNERIISEYLLYGMYEHSDDTFFKEIKSLRPGHYLKLTAEGIRIRQYWDILNAKNTYDYRMPRAALEEQLRELVADSIRIRFRSDVPVGVFLSSGLDSNTLLHFGREVTGHPVQAFSMCSPIAEWSECPLIEEVLPDEEKGAWHTVTPELRLIPELIDRMVATQDQPFGGLPTVAYGELCALAKEKGVTVLLQGEAMDELMAGYSYYRAEGGARLLSQDSTREIYSDILNAELRVPEPTFEHPSLSKLQNAQYRDLMHTKLPRVLRFNDHASMAYSREVRMPYLDPRIVEFCFWLPDELKIDGGIHKALMRSAFKDVLPKTACHRAKKAFGAWQSAWFRTKEGSAYADAILSSALFRSRPYWNHARLQRKVNDFKDGRGDNSFFLWQCINLELWFRASIDYMSS